MGGVAATAIAVLGSLGAPPPAQASNFGVELNGTYLVSTNGEQAKTNDVYMDERSEIQTWTVSSTCVSPIECNGQVTSDQGWSTTMRLNEYWYVERTIPNWAPCPDGSFADGYQKFMFWGLNPRTIERRLTFTDFMVGRDVVKTESGACGKNLPLVIEMPVILKRV
jgi:hypothetical protein